jgi:hypothetical protein
MDPWSDGAPTVQVFCLRQAGVNGPTNRPAALRDYFFLSLLHAASAPVGSMAADPSSMCWIRPSMSTTKVARFATPLGMEIP